MDFPEDIIVLILSLIDESEEIIPCLTTCKSWVSIVQSSNRLQRHLFYVFWGVKIAASTPEGDSIYQRHLEMKRNFFRALSSTQARLEWKAPGLVDTVGTSADDFACGQLATEQDEAKGLVYFVNLLKLYSYASEQAGSKEVAWTSLSALCLRCFDASPPSAPTSFRDVVLGDYEQCHDVITVPVLRAAPSPLDAASRAPLAVSDSFRLTKFLSGFVCWQYNGSIHVLNLRALTVKTWPQQKGIAWEFQPLTDDLAHSNGFFSVQSSELIRIDFGDTFRVSWKVSVPARASLLNYSDESSLLVLSDHSRVAENQEAVVCVANSNTGELSTVLNLGVPPRFSHDTRVQFHFTAPRRGLLVTPDAVRLLSIGHDLEISILDTFSIAGHVLRASSYAYNILTLEASSSTGFVIPDDSTVHLLRISGKKIHPSHPDHPAAPITVVAPATMILDRNFNLYVSSQFAPHHYAMYRLLE
jgi:hypothetical protein